MKNNYLINAIGSVNIRDGEHAIALDRKYAPALAHLDGFSHVQVLWWAHQTDHPQDRDTLVAGKLFKNGPDGLGVFATRSPRRPNPIMVSTVRVAKIDYENGIIHTPFIDAEDGTPVMDIKPYFPMERIREPEAPSWCSHWPQWQEETVRFNWVDEINMP